MKHTQPIVKKKLNLNRLFQNSVKRLSEMTVAGLELLSGKRKTIIGKEKKKINLYSNSNQSNRCRF